MRSRAALEPLAEEPGGGEEDASARRRPSLHAALRRWARLLSGAGDGSRVAAAADLRVLLSVLACPLSPVPLLPRLPRNVSTSPVRARTRIDDHRVCALLKE
jgi:hypothetical protein